MILLGLGLSTALLAYMFLNSFKDDGGSYSTGSGYGSYAHDTSGTGYEYYRRGDFGRKGSRGKVMMILWLLNDLTDSTKKCKYASCDKIACRK